MSVRDAFNLEGRTALVTGGSRGLGLAMAGALGEMGAKVVISARKSDELDAAVASLQQERGVTAVRVVGDLSRAENVNPFVDAVAAAAGAPIDILVNNAGATWGAPAEEHPLEGWNKVIGSQSHRRVPAHAAGRRALDDPAQAGPHRQHRLGRGHQGLAAGASARHRLSHQQGRSRELHARARRRNGASSASP